MTIFINPFFEIKRRSDRHILNFSDKCKACPAPQETGLPGFSRRACPDPQETDDKYLVISRH